MNKIIQAIKYLIIFCCFNVEAAPIEFVVTSAVGGSDDFVTRKVATLIESKSDLRFLVVNKPGAGKIIGFNYVMLQNQPVVTISNSVITEHEVYKTVQTIYTLGTFNNMLVVSSRSNIKNLNDLIKTSVEREIIFGHGGEGSFSHRVQMLLCNNKMRCLPVPYKSGAPALIALLRQEIDVYASVSYGSAYILQNNNYRIIGNIKMPDAWVKIFAKNINEKNTHTIQKIMTEASNDFYDNIGLTK